MCPRTWWRRNGLFWWWNNEDDLKQREISSLDAVLLDIVGENDANFADNDQFIPTIGWRRDFEDANGRKLGSEKHVSQSSPLRSRKFSEVPKNIPEWTTYMGRSIHGVFLRERFFTNFRWFDNSFNNNLREKWRWSNSWFVHCSKAKKMMLCCVVRNSKQDNSGK